MWFFDNEKRARNSDGTRDSQRQGTQQEARAEGFDDTSLISSIENLLDHSVPNQNHPFRKVTVYPY